MQWNVQCKTWWWFKSHFIITFTISPNDKNGQSWFKLQNTNKQFLGNCHKQVCMELIYILSRQSSRLDCQSSSRSQGPQQAPPPLLWLLSIMTQWLWRHGSGLDGPTMCWWKGQPERERESSNPTAGCKHPQPTPPRPWEHQNITLITHTLSMSGPVWNCPPV